MTILGDVLDDTTERKIRSVAAELDAGTTETQVLADLVAEGRKVGEAKLILAAAKVFRPAPQAARRTL